VSIKDVTAASCNFQITETYTSMHFTQI